MRRGSTETPDPLSYQPYRVKLDAALQRIWASASASFTAKGVRAHSARGGGGRTGGFFATFVYVWRCVQIYSQWSVSPLQIIEWIYTVDLHRASASCHPLRAALGCNIWVAKYFPYIADRPGGLRRFHGKEIFLPPSGDVASL